jgi:hypothetical protein
MFSLQGHRVSRVRVGATPTQPSLSKPKRSLMSTPSHRTPQPQDIIKQAIITLDPEEQSFPNLPVYLFEFKRHRDFEQECDFTDITDIERTRR